MIHQILWDDYSSPERQFKRLKLALSKDIYANLLREIKEANHELREFTKDSHILESNRNRRRKKCQSIDFKLIRRQARSLYNVVVTGNAWRCGCRQYHVASLRLEPRPWEEDEDIGKDDGARGPRLKFRVLLSKSCPGNGLDTTWRWREIEIVPVETTGVEFDAQTVSVATLSLSASYVGDPRGLQSAQANGLLVFNRQSRGKPSTLRSLRLQNLMPLSILQNHITQDSAPSMTYVPRCIASVVSNKA